MRQQLSRTPHEGLALRVFVGAGAFSNEDQLGPRVPHSKDDILPVPGQLAALAVANVGLDFLQGIVFDPARRFTEKRQGGCRGGGTAHDRSYRLGRPGRRGT